VNKAKFKAEFQNDSYALYAVSRALKELVVSIVSEEDSTTPVPLLIQILS